MTAGGWRPVAAFVGALVLCACGVPTDHLPHTLDGTVGSHGPSTSASGASGTSAPSVAGPSVYFTRVDGRLARTGVPQELRMPTVVAVQDLLDLVVGGPAPPQRQHGLSSALPPDLILRVRGLVDGQVVVELQGELTGTGGGQSIDAVAQIVLTATSVAGVRSVRLSRAGQPLQAALADGRLTSGPLRAADYLSLVTHE